MRLKTAAYGADELQQYDHILIDLPPALGRLTLNGLIWADRVLAVTEPAAFSVKGVTEFLDTVKKVRSLPHLNPQLEFLGIIINKTSSPLTSEHSFQIGELETTYGTDVREPHLPLRTAMQDSVSTRSPLTKLTGRGAAIMTENSRCACALLGWGELIMALERKSSIRKAPVADVVEVLTSAENRGETVEPGRLRRPPLGKHTSKRSRPTLISNQGVPAPDGREVSAGWNPSHRSRD